MAFEEIILAVVIFFAACALVTQLLKRFAKAQTFASIFSIVRSKRPLKWFDKWSKLKGLNALAEFGLVLGFGVLAFDYLYAREQYWSKRLIYNAVIFVILEQAFSYLVSPAISASPIGSGWSFAFAIAFGLFGFAGFGVIALVSQAGDILVKLLAGEKALPGVAPVIPGIQIPNVPIFVPLHGWISLLIILIVHEGMHGLLARKNKISLKSAGLLLFGFLPIGAFVEPDEKEFQKAEPRSALRLLSAGATANLAFLVIGFVVVAAFSAFVFTPEIAPALEQQHALSVSGVRILEVTPTTNYLGGTIQNSAFGNLLAGDVVQQVNGVPIRLQQDFLDAAKLNAREIQISILRGEEALSFSLPKNAAGMIGVTIQEIPNLDFVAPSWYTNEVALWSFLASFFFWLLLLSFLIALVNFLPMAPFDGGRIAVLLLTPWFAKEKKREERVQFLIGRTLFYAILLLFVINALPLFQP
ncbi:MAG: site-2 protease family protein [Candidatus Diapherotrites archaeon]